MSRLACICAFTCVAIAPCVLAQDKRIGAIAFFGYEGFDTLAIRNSLPFREGSIISSIDDAKSAIKRRIGNEPTDIATVCCDSSGNMLVYIGVPGKSSHPIPYNKAPKGTITLPPTLVSIDDDIGKLLDQAVLEGRAFEDDTEGYALAKDNPRLRSKQLEFRDQARLNEDAVFKVVESSSDAQQRAIAATALGVRSSEWAPGRCAGKGKLRSE